MSYPQPATEAQHPYLFYEFYANRYGAVTIDIILNNIVPLLAKGESAIQALLADLSGLNPGELDQSRLMAAQMNMSRWQLVAQLLSNFASGVASGLKSTVQNVGR